MTVHLFRLRALICRVYQREWSVSLLFTLSKDEKPHSPFRSKPLASHSVLPFPYRCNPLYRNINSTTILVHRTTVHVWRWFHGLVFLIVTRHTISAGSRKAGAINNFAQQASRLNVSVSINGSDSHKICLPAFSASGLEKHTFYHDLVNRTTVHVWKWFRRRPPLFVEAKDKNSDVRGLHCACSKIGKRKKGEPILWLQLGRVIRHINNSHYIAKLQFSEPVYRLFLKITLSWLFSLWILIVLCSLIMFRRNSLIYNVSSFSTQFCLWPARYYCFLSLHNIAFHFFFFFDGMTLMAYTTNFSPLGRS